ncbi:MAG: hypothetical protein M3Y53_02815 [Thermoproteota archaeon]|nr:hypothetical protein [Thermoproteota archaeon]
MEFAVTIASGARGPDLCIQYLDSRLLCRLTCHMQWKKLLKSSSTAKNTAVLVVLLLLGSLSVVITSPFKQVSFANIFTGDESASFFSAIRILQAEANIVQTYFATNPSTTQANVNAKINTLNAILQEAIAVRVPKDPVSNFTINGEATKDVVYETL